jgi:hypothetical protein
MRVGAESGAYSIRISPASLTSSVEPVPAEAGDAAVLSERAQPESRRPWSASKQAISIRWFIVPPLGRPKLN